MTTSPIQTTTPAEPSTRRKRGRPRKRYALVQVTVNLSPRTYDAYCRVALRAGLPLAVVLRHVLRHHAPRTPKTSAAQPAKSYASES